MGSIAAISSSRLQKVGLAVLPKPVCLLALMRASILKWSKADDIDVRAESVALDSFWKTDLARGCPFLSGWTILARFLKYLRVSSELPRSFIPSTRMLSGVSLNFRVK